MKAKRTNEECTGKKTWWKYKFLLAASMQLPARGGVGAARIYSIATTGPTFGRMNTLNRKQEHNLCSETPLLCRSGRDTGGKNNFWVSSDLVFIWHSRCVWSVPASPASEKNRSERPENWTSNTAHGGKTIIEKVILEKVLTEKKESSYWQSSLVKRGRKRKNRPELLFPHLYLLIYTDNSLQSALL